MSPISHRTTYQKRYLPTKFREDRLIFKIYILMTSFFKMAAWRPYWISVRAKIK